MKKLIDIFNESNKSTIIKDVTALSSGTMGTLTGLNKYTDLNKVQTKFIQFTIGVLDSAPNEFKTWMDAWNRFKEVYDIKTLKLK